MKKRNVLIKKNHTQSQHTSDLMYPQHSFHTTQSLHRLASRQSCCFAHVAHVVFGMAVLAATTYAQFPRATAISKNVF